MNAKVSPHVIRSGMNEGVKAIQREIDEHGTDEDKECLHYVLYEKAGTSATRFANGVRDQGRENETFDDFCNHPDCKECHLEPAHVLALRLYSTAAYKSINGSAASRERSPPLACALAHLQPPSSPQARCATRRPTRGRIRWPSPSPLSMRECVGCARWAPRAVAASGSSAARQRSSEERDGLGRPGLQP